MRWREALFHRPEPLIAVTGLAAGLVMRYGLGALTLAGHVLLVTLIFSGSRVVIGTIRGTVHGHFAADIIATLSILVAAATGEYLAGCVIALMQTGGEALEDAGKRRASDALDKLLSRAPQTAHRLQGASVEDISVTAIQPGDLLLIRPGEILPADGTVEHGAGAVDEAALTGEAAPVAVEAGSSVMSGSICLDGALTVRAIRPSSESQYERIVRLVRTAQGQKAPIGRLADRYAVVFTPLTLVVAALAYALVRRPEAVLAVLVVATPCPLILATPIAVVSGINRAAKYGILAKSGEAIEQIGQTSAVVFDKTGTLTTGVPVLERIISWDGSNSDDLLRLGGGLEQHSGHPMARAFVAAAQSRLGTLPLPDQVVELAGQGVSGQVEQRVVDVGSLSYAARRQLAGPEALQRARNDVEAEGHAVAVIGLDGHAAGLAVFTDPLRAGVPELLRRLRSLGVKETVMLSGDDEATVAAIAAEAGITTARANLLPDQKVEELRAVMSRHRVVAMVGDGINDAPALATATVGIALGVHGAAISAETADIVITTDDTGRVADAVQIGQRTLAVARQGIWVGMGVSGVLMIVAAFGFIPPTLGAVLQELLDIAVILNALRG
ncbi:MAG: heavy metal translocating P-type ATPase [Chloroflexi bacterium]|nr:heavy metal translocating P-type ATPase [Chloroflexota bacterium]